MTTETIVTAGPYRLPADRHYDAGTHLWVAPLASSGRAGAAATGRVRCGFDPLGSETSGDVVALSFAPVGTRVERGGELGTIEAAKFVGPLLSPVAGRVAAHNPAVLADPALLNRDPLEHWMVELEIADESALDGLLTGADAVRGWFESEIERFRRKGMIAE